MALYKIVFSQAAKLSAPITNDYNNRETFLRKPETDFQVTIKIIASFFGNEFLLSDVLSIKGTNETLPVETGSVV